MISTSAPQYCGFTKYRRLFELIKSGIHHSNGWRSSTTRRWGFLATTEYSWSQKFMIWATKLHLQQILDSSAMSRVQIEAVSAWSLWVTKMATYLDRSDLQMQPIKCTAMSNFSSTLFSTQQCKIFSGLPITSRFWCFDVFMFAYFSYFSCSSCV